MNKNAPTLGVLLLAAVATPAVSEVVPGTDLSVHFESGQIIGSGRHINMLRVPVINVKTGQTTFYDAAFKFTFVPGAGFEFEQISSAILSPPLAVTNLVTGLYKTTDNQCFELKGPTQIGARSLYTLTPQSSIPGCFGGRLTAQIVSGAASGHPDIGAREIVPFLSDQYVYGVISNRGFGQDISINWEENELIGLRQSGDNLIIGLFSEGTDNEGKPQDFKDPVETAILTRVADE
ncbi:hypothetical protein MIT9_P1853 [Methylomarinovum caldicuralii]|uniref:Uncharacterized protein n=1 Tax=Methylomarinovum caldicuralii TaxID=438856 RepID=A0AAU9CWC1_9GAMM|nr:hypothetical protein [Methylomarinovum caldicuralii]BCX82267.1 hypothetical protein MIT9_P1853 [Methylomarinovum caldicuralii]